MIVPAANDWIQQAFVREFGNKLSSEDFYYNENGQLVMTETYDAMMKSLHNIDLSNVIELDDNTDLSGELACAGGACEIK